MEDLRLVQGKYKRLIPELQKQLCEKNNRSESISSLFMTFIEVGCNPLILIYLRDNEVIAWAAQFNDRKLIRDEVPWYRTMFYVLPGERGKGIGNDLLQRVLALTGKRMAVASTKPWHIKHGTLIKYDSFFGVEP